MESEGTSPHSQNANHLSVSWAGWTQSVIHKFQFLKIRFIIILPKFRCPARIEVKGLPTCGPNAAFGPQWKHLWPSFIWIVSIIQFNKQNIN